jgi:hypothetical protein
MPIVVAAPTGTQLPGVRALLDPGSFLKWRVRDLDVPAWIAHMEDNTGYYN